MPRRMGRPGLVGTMARTAVVAGTATAVAGNVSRRQQGKADQQAAEQQAVADQQYRQQAAAEQQYQQQAEPAPAADDLGAQIERLATLKTAGVISEAEFSAAKAKLLGI
ncbi:SHOCT domain-containing protein [Cryobacterium sp. TMT3-29-2]|uniref:SHOCT domain-containing protein n=1 Tax=Cryobacterium sp. TMT3-29-2 TaxID=2555867 RepID=UPI001F542EA8|nr:SHOCT domain-containing protein [Cryobacterium sp. TMT3-29-2]